MTKTKLEIIGPYTPDHEGPFCTRDGLDVRLITRTDGHTEYPIVGIVGNEVGASVWDNSGSFFGDGQRDSLDLMNAREVPVARELWVNEYENGALYYYKTQEEAYAIGKGHGFVRTIHVREVLPGDE